MFVPDGLRLRKRVDNQKPERAKKLCDLVTEEKKEIERANERSVK